MNTYKTLINVEKYKIFNILAKIFFRASYIASRNVVVNILKTSILLLMC